MLLRFPLVFVKKYPFNSSVRSFLLCLYLCLFVFIFFPSTLCSFFPFILVLLFSRSKNLLFVSNLAFLPTFVLSVVILCMLSLFFLPLFFSCNSLSSELRLIALSLMFFFPFKFTFLFLSLCHVSLLSLSLLWISFF